MKAKNKKKIDKIVNAKMQTLKLKQFPKRNKMLRAGKLEIRIRK